MGTQNRRIWIKYQPDRLASRTSDAIQALGASNHPVDGGVQLYQKVIKRSNML
jgi:hypothetical protein